MRRLLVALLRVLFQGVGIGVLFFLLLVFAGYSGVLRDRHGAPATAGTLVLMVLLFVAFGYGATLAWRRRIRRAYETLRGAEPMAREARADGFVRKGRYDEALAEYLWCFDHGHETSPAYGGVRLSFLLRSIADLGKIHPPAIDALKIRRDRAEAAVLGGGGTPLHAMEAGAINRVLGDVDRTVAMADRLDTKGPAAERIRAVLLDDILDTLLEARRYADILKMSGPPHGHVERAIESFRFTRNEVRSPENLPVPPGLHAEDIAEVMAEHGPELLRHQREEVATTAGKFVEALLGTGRKDEAQRIADQALDFDPSAETLAVLVRHARRAGDAATAQEWEARSDRRPA